MNLTTKKKSNMESLIVLTIVFVLGYFIGWVSYAIKFFKHITENPDEMISILNKYKQQTTTQQQPHIREITVEKHENILYVYDKENNQFLAQGSTLQEALNEVNRRFPDKNFKGFLSKEDADQMGLSTK